MSYRAPAKEKCHACGKTVYAMEMMKADNLVFHKQCMKCTECNKTLSLGNYAALEGRYFCKPHFKQLFALKGNYSEGFGEEQHKMKWVKKDGEGNTPNELSPAAHAQQEADPLQTNVVKSGSNVNAAQEAAAVVGSSSPAAARRVFEQGGSPAREEAAAPAVEEEAAPAAAAEEEAAPAAAAEEAAPAAEEEAAPAEEQVAPADEE